MAIENITEAQKVNLVKLYLAYFNRAPETQGLDYHVAQFLADLNAGLSEEQAFAKRDDSFYQAAIDVPAWSGYSVSMTAAEFVAKMYDNVLLRRARAAAGPCHPDPAASCPAFDATTNRTARQRRLN